MEIAEKGEIEEFRNDEIENSRSQKHIQKIFGMPEDKWREFRMLQLMVQLKDGSTTLLAFGWTPDRGDNYVANIHLFIGDPYIMKKIYMEAGGWLHGVAVYPYLTGIGNTNLRYRRNSFMIINPKHTDDNEETYGEPGYYSSRIGSWTCMFAIVNNINRNWSRGSYQKCEWSKLVLLYDAMHFI